MKIGCKDVRTCDAFGFANVVLENTMVFSIVPTGGGYTSQQFTKSEHLISV